MIECSCNSKNATLCCNQSFSYIPCQCDCHRLPLLKRLTNWEYSIIKEFVRVVEERAEAEIEKTHKIEGAHFRAMYAELRLLEKEHERS